jgi:hypothetical protein
VVSLKKWLDSHPGPVALGIAVSVATTTVAVTTYFSDQLHKTEKAQIESKHLLEVSDLTTRLSSIERRAGSDQSKRYFDVQSMQVSQSEVKSLPSQFTGFDDGNFFVNVPVNHAWNYEFLSYTQVAKLGVFKSFVDSLDSDQLVDLFDRNKVHIWYSKPAAEIKYAVDEGELKSGTLTSHVKIQKVTRQEYAKNAADVADAARKNRSEPKKDIGTTIGEIERLKEESSDADPEKADASEANSRTRKLFEQLFEGDTAGLIFIDILVQNWQLAQLEPYISFSILSAQKQLNVMYADLEIRLSRTKVEKSYDETCKEGSSPTVVIRREIFFVSYGGGGYLISAEVPTCDGRSKAFDWISQWLAGLRIAVKGIG